MKGRVNEMFRGKAWKWLLVGSAMTIIVLYMLEMTTTGIERVYGPLSPQQSVALQPNEAYQAPNTTNLSSETVTIDPSLSPLEQEIVALEQEVARLKKQTLENEKTNLQSQLLLNEAAEQPAVNRLADTTSGVLQNASSSGMQYIAQLFSKVIN